MAKALGLHPRDRKFESCYAHLICRDVIAAMIEDVKRESEGEVEWSKEVERAIGKATAESFKRNLKLRLV